MITSGTMKCGLLLLAFCLAANAKQLLNEDQLRDELNYASNTRSKRALCGEQGKATRPPFVFPTRSPSCLLCTCSSSPWNPIVNPILSKKAIFRPVCSGSEYLRCCKTITNPWISGAKASASVSDSSINSMASNLINKFGKRANDDKFKKPSVDLVFLIDDSGSIPAPQFEVAKEGAATLSQALCPQEFGNGKGQKQVSVALFSTTAQTVMTFEESRQGVGYVEDKILGIKQRSGSTATTEAITHVREKILSGPGSRLNDPDTATIVFVITDGKCNNYCSNLKAEADKLRKAGPGVQVFAFGVGEADCDELELIRGAEAGEVFGLPDFNFFEKLANAVKEQMAKNTNACVNN